MVETPMATESKAGTLLMLQDQRERLLDAATVHVKSSHIEAWLGIVAKAHRAYSGIYSTDIPSCPACEFFAQALALVNEAITDLVGEEGKT